MAFAGAGFTYCEAGIWKYECRRPSGGVPGPEEFVDIRHEVIEDGGARALRVIAHNDRLRLTKTFALAPSAVALRIGYRIEATAPHQLEWGYTSLFRLSRSPERWLLPENRVEAGRVVRRLAPGPSLRARTVGNQEFYPTVPDAVAVYYQADDCGLVFVNAPACPLAFRSGEPPGQTAFVGLRFEVGQFGADGVLSSDAVLVPFAGEPLAAADQALAAYRDGTRAPGVPDQVASGRLLVASAEGTLWWDLPTAKVFPNAVPPAEHAAAVDLSAARGEAEPFQIVLRPTAPLTGVRLVCLPLASTEAAIDAGDLRWNPLACYPCELPLTVTDIVGEVPDTLLPDLPVDCPAARSQAFWVTVHIPEATRPGRYQGEVQARTGERLVAAVPLRLTVRGFALPRERSFAAFLDPWRHCVEKHYGREKTAALWPSLCQRLAEHRAAPLHPAASGPTATWDDQGAIATFDCAAFDVAMEEYWRTYRQPMTVLGTFTIGWGHVPRDNRFGKAGEILSPLWQARCRSFATALRDHLREKGWSGKLVFSLFDEPAPAHYGALAQVARLLREIAPEWRFTYWGSYAPQLDGAMQVWTVPMEMYDPRLARKLRERGEEVCVYNPPGYRVSSSALAARAAWWWLWREHVPGLYQWTVTAWVEWTGNTELWDPYRNASWLVPGAEVPLDTVRFELAREGIEDYEYLVRLEKLTAQAEAAGQQEGADLGRRLLEQSRLLAWCPDDGRAAVLHTDDPWALHELRDRIGAAIERLEAALP
jgi:hypothetical protein